MDPVTAFGLVAGVLQVVDFSFRALNKCREIYKDGSLAEHRNTAEVVRHLADTTVRLRATVDGTPKPILQGHNEIVELSMECSQTAAELLTELEKLKAKPGVSFRQAVSKSLKAIRRRGFIDEVQRKLEKYQTILDTRILVELNSKSIQQGDDFQILDQNVQDLVIAMTQGRDTAAQLLADHGLAIRNHIDQGLVNHALMMSRVSAQQQFKDSLFFPEMFSRQDHIAEEHQGTYRWIFQPPHDGESQKVDGEPAVTGKGSDVIRDDGEARDDRKKGRQWSNFVAWLEYGKGIYWLNGKLGSGKSTLMKFITNNIWENAATTAAMVKWAGDNHVVTASFHFWTLGSTGLQKSLQGLLRSLFFQIASQQQDLIPILMGHPQHSAREFELSQALPIYEWTERRLRSVLQHFLDHKPSSVSLCIFIDGLDEMEGDEEVLIDILRLLNDTPHTKICVSSRREQIFRQEFSASPQIRLQDLNHEDIKKTATENLLPALMECFPRDEKAICSFIEHVILKAEGVFLWLELIMKDIKRAARYNADSLLELAKRLKITPSSIDGLYEQMLDRTDKAYLPEAGKYFRFLMADRTRYNVLATLMDFITLRCVSISETRLLTRCAGLVEVAQQSPNAFPSANQEKHKVCDQLRLVSFIHKSAMEFLQNHRPALLEDRDGHSARSLSLLRGAAGVLSIMPVALSENDYPSFRRMITSKHVSLTMQSLASFVASRASSEEPALGSVAVEMVDDVYQIIERVNAFVVDPDTDWYEYQKMFYPPGELRMEGSHFRNVHEFAAFLGFRNYLSYQRLLCTYSLEENNYLLACTIRGLTRSSLDDTYIPGYCALIDDLLCHGADPDLSLNLRENLVDSCCMYTISAWGALIYIIALILPRIAAARSRGHSAHNSPTLDQVLQYFGALIETYLSHDAYVNTRVGHFVSYSSGCFDNDNGRLWKVGIVETPLAYLKRAMNSKVHHDISPLINLLLSWGAFERRRFHLVAAAWDGGKGIWQVSEEDSERLCEVWPDGNSDEDDDSLFGAFLGLKPSLYKYNVENEKITFNSESSW